MSIYLIGTNSDKATTFDKDEAKKYAEEYNLTYLEVNCLTTHSCETVMREAVAQVCVNMTRGVY